MDIVVSMHKNGHCTINLSIGATAIQAAREAARIRGWDIRGWRLLTNGILRKPLYIMHFREVLFLDPPKSSKPKKSILSLRRKLRPIRK